MKYDHNKRLGGWEEKEGGRGGDKVRRFIRIPQGV